MKRSPAKSSAEKKSAPPKDVDAYLADLPAGVSAALEKLRKAIKAAAPKAEEVISYRIPTYKYHGPLVHFMAHPDHCSFVTASKSVVDDLSDDLKNFDVSGTTIHFSAEHPLPTALVKRIVKARMHENELRVELKRK